MVLLVSALPRAFGWLKSARVSHTWYTVWSIYIATLRLAYGFTFLFRVFGSNALMVGFLNFHRCLQPIILLIWTHTHTHPWFFLLAVLSGLLLPFCPEFFSNICRWMTGLLLCSMTWMKVWDVVLTALGQLPIVNRLRWATANSDMGCSNDRQPLTTWPSNFQFLCGATLGQGLFCEMTCQLCINFGAFQVPSVQSKDAWNSFLQLLSLCAQDLLWYMSFLFKQY